MQRIEYYEMSNVREKKERERKRVEKSEREKRQKLLIHNFAVFPSKLQCMETPFARDSTFEWHISKNESTIRPSSQLWVERQNRIEKKTNTHTTRPNRKFSENKRNYFSITIQVQVEQVIK